jgi:error-prone DNA polymerase
MLAVYLPAFRLERCGYDPTEPVVLIEFARSTDRVLACTPPVARAGVLPGMALAEARALCPTLRVERRVAERERGDLESLRDTGLRFSPAVSAVLPDALFFDVGADQAPAVRRWLEGLGHGVRLVWGPEPWSALVLARHAPRDLVLHGPRDVARALAPLGVAALGLDADVLESLGGAGVHTIGQFAALPGAALAGRYGPEARRLWQVARGEASVAAAAAGLGARAAAAAATSASARARAVEKGQAALPAALQDDPVYTTELDEGVVELEAVLFVLHGLCRDVAEHLERVGTAAARVQVRLRLEAGELLLPIRTGQPVRGADRLFRQLRARLEREQLAAPVTAVSLALLQAVPWRAGQPGLFDRAGATEPLPELLARLQDSLGSEAVFRPAPADEWRPEVGWARVAPGEAASPPAAPKKADPALVHEPDAAAWSGHYPDGKLPREAPVPAHRPRPALLLPAPRPLRVAVGPSGRPRALLLDHDAAPIRDLTGPERLVGEWWKARTGYARDYWCATLADGRRAWLYSESLPTEGDRPGLQRWFLHGWLDGGGGAPFAVVPDGEVEAGGRPRFGSRPGEGEAATGRKVLAFPGARLPSGPAAPGERARGVPEPEAGRVEGGASGAAPSRGRSATPRYAELCARSALSFSEGASMPEDLYDRAEALGLGGLAITDRDGVYGAVRAHRHARGRTVPLLHGALLTVRNGRGAPGASVVALVQSLRGWGTLCRLLSAERIPGGAVSTEGVDLDQFSIGIPHDPRSTDPLVVDPAAVAASRHLGKGWPALPLDALLAENEGLVLIAREGWSADALHTLADAAGDRLYRGVSRLLAPGEEARVDTLVAGPLPCVAIGDVLMHDPARKPLQDILTCIRLGLTLDQAGRRLQPNAERVIHGPEAMARRFARWPALLDRTLEIVGRCSFSLKELTYAYPREVVPEGYGAQAWLRELVRRGLMSRYGGEPPEKVARQVEYELGVIGRLNFPAYFLTVHDLVRFARRRGILCQGRGSAANSAVCFALGITNVDPADSALLFERFISEERGEPPDIDVDFEHERREEVIQYCYEKYGRHRAAMVNEVISYRGRSAVRDVGKAVGLGLDQVDRLCGLLDSWGSLKEGKEVLTEAGLDPTDERVGLAMRLGREIQGFPRHTSIHVGGFVISEDPLVNRAPIEPATMPGRTVIQWDKDDIDELGFVKVDCLALGMLSAIRKAFDLVRATHGVHHDLATVPREDPAVYEMLGEADSIGVFQVESRAQQGMLPRLKPKCFYDLVIEVSVVRPGPIQGGMVHPYLRRRQGLEAVEYADPRLVPILERTLGVPIFQEQVMAMAVAVGGFTPGEADGLRRAMGAWRKRGGLAELTDKLMRGLLGNGLEPEYAERVCKQIQGFAEYGFPESHAASFAHLVYVSSWLRCFYPAAFTAALINSQPMGFYAPRTLVADIERHGVEVRPVCAQRSDWDCTLEEGADGPALRLGLRIVKGVGEAEGRRIERARRDRAFVSLPDLAARATADRGVLRALARANALAAVPVGGRQDRRAASFAVDGLWPGLFAGLGRSDDTATLPIASEAEEMQADYASVGLTPGTHPLALVRGRLDREHVTPLSRLIDLPNDAPVVIAGLVGVRQRPDTASGVIFLMLEDETGTANVVVWPKLYQRQRTVIRTQRLLRIRGVLQRMDGAISIVARHVRALDVGAELQAKSRDFH